jgi:hypothetical protein
MTVLDLSMSGVKNAPANMAPPVVFSSPPETVVLPAPVVAAPVAPVVTPVVEVAPVVVEPVVPVVEEVTPVVVEETLSDIKPDEVIPEAAAVTAPSEEDLIEKVMTELETSRATIAEQALKIAALEDTNLARLKRLESLVLTGKAVVNDSGTSTRPAESSSAVHNNPTTSTGELNLLMR